jgi:hypothetical protein
MIFGRRFEVAKWGRFCDEPRLDNRLARLKFLCLAPPSEVVGQGLDRIIIRINRCVRVRQKQINSVKLHTVHLGVQGQVMQQI